MRLVGFLIFSILVQLCSVHAVADNTMRLKGPKASENPDRSRVGPLTPNDTLWRIAEETRPHPGLNIYQVMYAIYLKNPQSFLDDNFNHLNVGSFLAIPNVDEILMVDALDAQRKSEEDDRIWAERVRAAAAAKIKQGVNTAQQKDVDNAKQEIKKELIRVEGQQHNQLLELQQKLAESKRTVEAVLADNTALKNKLDQLAEQMLLMKSQVDKDSEIQQQLQLLVAQQAEMLAQQKARIEQEQQGTNFAGWWQNISSSSLTWVLLASLPTLFVLMAVLGWIKRRTRKSEQIVSAATAVPQQEPGYRSPLPPLDESLDFDESSLMTLDESLLDSGRGIRLDDEPVDLHDDMLLDTRADEFDDILLNDDDLLDSKDLFDASAMDDELLDDLLEQPATVADKEFDPDNILSGADLSALFESEDENPDDVFAQAVAEQLAEEQKQEAKADDGSDELIEEIELDEPDNDTTAPQSQVTETTGRFELDEVEEVEEVDFDSLLDELAVSKDDVEVEPEQTTKVESPAVPAALLDTPAEPAQFDSSELDEFAESLADEELSGTDTASESDETEIDIDALLAGNTSWPTETEPEVVSQEQKPQPEPVSVGAETALDFDEDDYPLSPEDVALLLSEDVTLQKETEFPEAAEQQVVEPADESTETEAADLWQELVEPAAESKLSEAVPDLDLQEDPTVSRVSAATLSVENPSKVLEQYPELEFSDDAALLEEPEDELLQSELPAEQHNQTELANEDIPAELEALDSFDFDALLADYTQEEPASRQQDEQVADAVLAELNATGAAPASAETKSWQDPELSVTESDDLEFSLQALDKLLDDSDEEDSSENAEPNLDVGLENYQDFIAAQHEPELDPAEQAYAADLDLIRAYIEIGEQEGAEHLIDKVLNSAAPEHIKQEAQSLKDQL